MLKTVFILGILLSAAQADAVTMQMIAGPPGSSTLLYGISGNLAVGYQASGTSVNAYAYNIATGSWTPIVNPNTGSSAGEAFGIQGSRVVGATNDSAGNHAFIYDMANGSYQTFDEPDANPTYGGTAFNALDGNEAVGIFGHTLNSPFIYSGFLYNIATGSWKTLDEPNANGATMATGISGNTIVGYYRDSAGISRGFIYDIPSGTWTNPAYVPLGIQGTSLVGYYSDGKRDYAFFSPPFTLWDGPIAIATAIDGTNVVGYGGDGHGGLSGFLVVVPEPSSLILLIVGLSVAAAWRLRRPRSNALDASGRRPTRDSDRGDFRGYQTITRPVGARQAQSYASDFQPLTR